MAVPVGSVPVCAFCRTLRGRSTYTRLRRTTRMRRLCKNHRETQNPDHSRLYAKEAGGEAAGPEHVGDNFMLAGFLWHLFTQSRFLLPGQLCLGRSRLIAKTRWRTIKFAFECPIKGGFGLIADFRCDLCH